MKGSTAQVRYGGTAAKSGGQVQQVVKGRAAVDASCPHAAEMHVYDGGGDDVYDALLNQADIGANKNKYYILQLLESDASPHAKEEGVRARERSPSHADPPGRAA